MEDQQLQAEQAPVASSVKKTVSPQRAFAYGVGSVLVLVAIAAVYLGVRATRQLSHNPSAIRFADAFHIAVARVNGIPVNYSEYVGDVETLTKFYRGAGAAQDAVPTSEQISDQVLSRLVVNAIVADQAKKYGVSVSDDEVQKSELLARLLSAFPTSADAEKELQSRYNLTLVQYTKKVVTPVVLEQKLQEKFVSSTDDAGKTFEEEQVRASHILFAVTDPKKDASVKAQALAVLKRAKAGEDFAKLAGQYGTDSTKTTGGDLGWFGRGRMVPEFEKAAFALRPRELAPDLVKTQYGYHIITVTEKRMARDYSAFMNSVLKNANIEILLPVHNPFTDLQKQLGAPADAGAATTK